MSMSIVSFRVVVFVVNSLYIEKGGQCSFYLQLPIKSRFLIDLNNKNQVVFDTTASQREVTEMNKLIRFCITAGLIFLLSGLLLSACGAIMGGASYPDIRPHRIHRIMERLDDCI